MKVAGVLAAILSSAALVQGQVALWGQCGGTGYTGSTTCAAGAVCNKQNDYYSQCIPSANVPSSNPTTAPTTEPSTPSSASPSSSTPPSNGGNKSSGCGKPAGITSGTYTLTVNGKSRQYILRVPQNYNPSNGYKLIFTLHWYGGSMQDAAAIEGGYYGLQAQAKESAIFVSPNGLNQGWGNTGGEDVTLIDTILDKVSSNLSVDTTQVFATGFSYGAAFCYTLACYRPDKFRGVALYAGGQLGPCDGTPKPVAFWATHGVYDRVVDIAKGRALRDHFVQVNGCQAKNAPEPTSGQPHTKTVYSCKAGYTVWYYGNEGGHVADPKDPGQSQSWAPAEVWSFFSQLS
ncbi:unnamed protein product [Aphanomyces euteiches]